MTGAHQHLPAAADPASGEVRAREAEQFVTFHFGRHLFGLPIDEVIEINRALEITPVPLGPPYVAGVVNLRGQILTAIHLARRVGLADAEEERGTYNNVIIGDRDEPVSLLVEEIGDVMSIPALLIEPPPPLISGMNVRFVKQVCKLQDRLLIILDGEALQQGEAERGAERE
ncbi:chemotaxis protein CheW [Dissulfurirhabdus thermomarina]|uniref:Chemotaxis protein CheW n=1 Tax=Dissulfurirhabdus thermomarina TaxID=1765737 RepID=A0A6N9TQ22_DISTH|nr:chemotaxis protein CheW [Dissulfurirhabdus thermomarina]NDY41834.1 chemotaxis protein CheW [Dissulfurirhabdus thermomarina]NMX22477.1 chemotaxis protein CheW [Dissulfurirhabdus thermomarina]